MKPEIERKKLDPSAHGRDDASATDLLISNLKKQQKDMLTRLAKLNLGDTTTNGDNVI